MDLSRRICSPDPTTRNAWSSLSHQAQQYNCAKPSHGNLTANTPPISLRLSSIVLNRHGTKAKSFSFKLKQNHAPDHNLTSRSPPPLSRLLLSLPQNPQIFPFQLETPIDCLLPLESFVDSTDELAGEARSRVRQPGRGLVGPRGCGDRAGA